MTSFVALVVMLGATVIVGVVASVVLGGRRDPAGHPLMRRWPDPGRRLLRQRLSHHVVEPDGLTSVDEVQTAQPSMIEVVWTTMAPPAKVVEDLADRALRRHGALNRVQVLVVRSGLGVGAAEVAGASAVSAATTAVVMAIGGLPLPVVVGGVMVAGSLPVVVVSMAAARRRKLFAMGLADVLNLLAGTLRAGFPLSQAVTAVAEDMGGPVAQEFRRLAAEVNLGRPLPTAMRAVATRMGNDEMEWVAVAVEIHQQAGGNLAEVLDTVAATSTDRQRLQREVATLTAEGRLSALVLGILPPALAVVISVLNPGYLGSLMAEPVGMAMVAASAVAMVVGFVWMHRIVGIDL
jgi:tight adherence protein B